VKCTVWSSTLRTPSGERTPLNAESADDPTFGSLSIFIVATTSSTVSGLPSCHFTPWRIVNSHSLALPVCFQAVARRGWRDVSAMRLHSVSPASWAVKMPPWSKRNTGSTSAVGTAQPRRNVPPRFTGPAAAEAPVLVLFAELPPQAASSVPIDDADRPATVARTISWRRVSRPARTSSTRWYS
jgi:hypothetical protein